MLSILNEKVCTECEYNSSFFYAEDSIEPYIKTYILELIELILEPHNRTLSSYIIYKIEIYNFY